MRALQLTAYGNPKDVIKLVEQPEFGSLATDEWVIDLEARRSSDDSAFEDRTLARLAR